MSGHDQRCEWSAAPPARCRCACQGLRHGIKRVRELLARRVDEMLTEPDPQVEEASP